MPVSDIQNIAPILSEVVRLNPQTIIELGIGLGKYGVLCREVLDGVRGFVRPNAATTFIAGIEGFSEYSNPAWDVYDNVMVADFVDRRNHITNWDLVMMIDSLEHVEKTQAMQLLRFLVTHNRHVIVSVPVGHCPQGAVFGNEFECHRSTWSGVEDFAHHQPKLLHQGVCCVVSIKGNLK